jgi:thioredoxin
MIVRCPKCGSQNRLPDDAAGKTVVCGKCKTPLSAAGGGGEASMPGNGEGHPVTITDATFRNTIARGAVIVDFWAPWCGLCRTIGPLIEQLAAERRDLRFGKLNVDENRQTTHAFGVQGIPAIIFFRDGVEKGRVVGAVPRPQLEAAIRQYLG